MADNNVKGLGAAALVNRRLWRCRISPRSASAAKLEATAAGLRTRHPPVVGDGDAGPQFGSGAQIGCGDAALWAIPTIQAVTDASGEQGRGAATVVAAPRGP